MDKRTNLLEGKGKGKNYRESLEPKGTKSLENFVYLETK
jgi:hypothetical protein